MKFETIVYRQNYSTGRAIYDKQRSTPVRDMSEKEAEEYMYFLECMFCQKCETTTQISYQHIEDARYITEFVFYK